MRRLAMIVLFVLGLATALFPAAVGNAASPTTIRLSLSMPPGNFMQVQVAEFAKLAEQNSGGELKIQLFDSAQLYRDQEVIKAVATGAVDAGHLGSPWLGTQLVPAMKVYQIPFLFNTIDETIKVWNSKIGESWRETAEKKGVKLFGLTIFPTPEDSIISTIKPVKTPSDLKGMIIRAVGPEDAAVLKRWGAGPSFISGTEVYMGLQRGTIVGVIGSVLNFVELKRYEVAPYAVFVPLTVVHSYFGFNKALFDSLSPKQQKAIADAAATIEKNTKAFALKTLEQRYEDVKGKATFYRPNPAEQAQWREGITELWPDMVKDNADVAQALKDVRAMLGR